VHCVGHSLGSALATLAADTIALNARPKTVKLYTFGSPRVGFEGFSRRLTDNIGDENIYRVHHSTDIVSHVPEWPFIHVPVPGDAISIAGFGYNPISAHFKDNYLKTVTKLEGKGWAKLPTSP